MTSTQEKIKRLRGMGLHCVPDGDIASLTRIVRDCRVGIVLFNENSMVDTYRLDSFDNGLVGSQSVDLEAMAGNNSVLNLIELMKSKKDVTFMPGTLLRDFGGYVLPVMPIIQDGKLVYEKVKQTGMAYIDDYNVLKQKLALGGRNEEVTQVVRNEVEARRRNNFRSISVNGLQVLPVICNELSLAPNLYNGKPIDVLMHSCEDLYDEDSKRKEAYQKILAQMNARGQINGEVVIAYTQGGENLSKGIMVYDNGIVNDLN